MQIIALSRNDSIEAIAEKCNLNFKELAFSSEQYVKKQGRIYNAKIQQEISVAVDGLITTTIPNEVSNQITDADIPGLVSSEVASQIGSDSTTTISDFITIDTNDVVAVNGVAHRWGKIAKISLTYRLKNPYVVMSDGKINNLQLGILTSNWMTVGGLTNVSLDATRQIEGVIDSNGLVAFMSANSRGTSYTIDENAVLYAGFTYILA
jgi:hypothetical protein